MMTTLFPGRTLVAPSPRLLACCAIVLQATVMLSPSIAQAQRLGLWAGGTVDPEQFFVGLTFETPAIADTVHVRPCVDGAFGGGQRTTVICVDIIYKTGDPAGWQFYTGGGPAVRIIRFDNPFDNPQEPGEEREVTGGLMGLLGLVHRSGFFTEFKFGGSGSGPNLKVGAGFTLGKTP